VHLTSRSNCGYYCSPSVGVVAQSAPTLQLLYLYKAIQNSKKDPQMLPVKAAFVVILQSNLHHLHVLLPYRSSYLFIVFVPHTADMLLDVIKSEPWCGSCSPICSHTTDLIPIQCYPEFKKKAPGAPCQNILCGTTVKFAPSSFAAPTHAGTAPS
jgi:hypothetical protein